MPNAKRIIDIFKGNSWGHLGSIIFAMVVTVAAALFLNMLSANAATPVWSDMSTTYIWTGYGNKYPNGYYAKSKIYLASPIKVKNLDTLLFTMKGSSAGCNAQWSLYSDWISRANVTFAATGADQVVQVDFGSSFTGWTTYQESSITYVELRLNGDTSSGYCSNVKLYGIEIPDEVDSGWMEGSDGGTGTLHSDAEIVSSSLYAESEPGTPTVSIYLPATVAAVGDNFTFTVTSSVSFVATIAGWHDLDQIDHQCEFDPPEVGAGCQFTYVVPSEGLHTVKACAYSNGWFCAYATYTAIDYADPPDYSKCIWPRDGTWLGTLTAFSDNVWSVPPTCLPEIKRVAWSLSYRVPLGYFRAFAVSAAAELQSTATPAGCTGDPLGKVRCQFSPEFVAKVVDESNPPASLIDLWKSISAVCMIIVALIGLAIAFA